MKQKIYRYFWISLAFHLVCFLSFIFIPKLFSANKSKFPLQTQWVELSIGSGLEPSPSAFKKTNKLPDQTIRDQKQKLAGSDKPKPNPKKEAAKQNPKPKKNDAKSKKAIEDAKKAQKDQTPNKAEPTTKPSKKKELKTQNNSKQKPKPKPQKKKAQKPNPTASSNKSKKTQSPQKTTSSNADIDRLLNKNREGLKQREASQIKESGHGQTEDGSLTANPNQVATLKRRYGLKIKSQIERYWFEKQTTLNAKVVIYINPNGYLVASRPPVFRKRSGSSAFDSRIQQALKKAQPFSKPPAQLQNLARSSGVLIEFSAGEIQVR